MDLLSRAASLRASAEVLREIIKQLNEAANRLEEAHHEGLRIEFYQISKSEAEVRFWKGESFQTAFAFESEDSMRLGMTAKYLGEVGKSERGTLMTPPKRAVFWSRACRCPETPQIILDMGGGT
jgi:hypothetical protein